MNPKPFNYDGVAVRRLEEQEIKGVGSVIPRSAREKLQKTRISENSR